MLTQNQAKIVDAGMAYSGLMNLPDKWPREEWRAKGGKDLFKVAGWAAGWKPQKGMVGNVVHKWSIGGAGTDGSWNDQNNYLLEVDGNMVPVAAAGLELGPGL